MQENKQNKTDFKNRYKKVCFSSKKKKRILKTKNRVNSQNKNL